MIDPIVPRKPKLHFDTADTPRGILFVNQYGRRRGLDWSHFVEVRDDPDDENTIWMQMGDYIIIIHGRNVTPLLDALAEHSILKLKALPDLAKEPERDRDTYVTSIHISPKPQPTRKSKNKDAQAGPVTAK